MVKLLQFIFVLSPILLQAQPAQKWDEKLLTGVVWSFQKTFEWESGQIIEKADTATVCDLLMESSHSYELFDQDELIRGAWDLQGDILLVSFRGRESFTLAQLTVDQLDLQFQAGRKQYIHRFSRPASANASAGKPAEAKAPVDRSASSKAPADRRTWIEGEREIRIELTGGGFFGGADPVQRDFILIKENGRLIHERQTVNTGLQVEKATLSTRQMAELADFIRSNGFFTMESRYGCATPECEDRLLALPRPVPLRLAVTDGLDRHVVEVAIWPEDKEKGAVAAFPSGLKNIVDAIRSLAE
ncbi:MAG: hypothetical protein IPH04_05175 [Saprospirales bacterium]|nr:hypothetical protein [Saprospirales bacterium]